MDLEHDTQVGFSLDVSQCDDVFGISLFVDSGEEDLTVYRMLLKGPNIDHDKLAEMFSQEHSAIMDDIGLSGEVEREVYEELLEDSIELASQNMKKHGYANLTFDEIPYEVRLVLFAEENTDPKSLN